MSPQLTLGVVVLVFYVDILLLGLLVRVLKPIVCGHTVDEAAAQGVRSFWFAGNLRL